MALPTYKGSGTFTAGVNSITPPMPTGGAAPAANDILILVVTSENETISLTTANGFVELPSGSPQSAGTAATDPASRLAVYWKRAAGSDSAPVVADSGNNTEAQIHCFSGCKLTGNPWDQIAGGNDSAANDTTGVIPGATTTVLDCLVVLICSSSFNSTGTANFSGWTNSNLASITERTDNVNTAGLGGGHGMATGQLATPANYGNTTVTLANTSFKGAISIALAAPITLAAAKGTYSLTGKNSNVLYKPVISAAQGTYSLTGKASTLLHGYPLTAAQGTYSLTGKDSNVLFKHLLSSVLGTYSLVGNTALTLRGYPLTASLGAYTLTGKDSNVLFNKKLSLNTGSYSSIGINGNFLLARIFHLNQGSYATIGNDDNFIFGRVFVLNCGNYVSVGKDANNLFNRKLSSIVGAYTQTGKNSNVLFNHLISLIPGSYSETGKDANVLNKHLISSESGQYSQSGKNSIVLFNRICRSLMGSYSNNGQDIGILRGYKVFAILGAYDLIGKNVNFNYGSSNQNYTILAGNGNYLLIGLSPDLARTYKLVTTDGDYSLDGKNNHLLKHELIAIYVNMHSGAVFQVFVPMQTVKFQVTMVKNAKFQVNL